jgi:hypothetical protein
MPGVRRSRQCSNVAASVQGRILMKLLFGLLLAKADKSPVI